MYIEAHRDCCVYGRGEREREREDQRRKSVGQEIKYYPVARRALGNSTPWIPSNDKNLAHECIFHIHVRVVYVFMYIVLVHSLLYMKMH